MRRIILVLCFVILLSSLVSAEVDIIINKQPDAVYNLGDSFSIPLTLKSLSEITGNLEMSLICGGKSTTFYKNGVKLSAGEEQRMNPVLVLTKENIGFTKGTCKIKTTFGEQYVLTNDFKISDVLTINLKSGEGEFEPGDEIIVEGEVTKENGELVNGFIDLEILSGNKSQNTYIETVNNGFFSIKFTLPAETAAGPYLISLNAYEKDLSGEVTNKGFFDYTIKVKQVPTSLEVVLENPEIEPGTNLKVKAVLHDQTGENIEGTTAVITIKDSADKILKQEQKTTNEFLEFPIAYNEPPANWTIFAVSNQLTGEAKVIIKEKKEVKYELINKTLVISNVGNVPYNDTVFIKIGEEMLNIPTFLGIDESKKYTLSAPDGVYEIEVVNEEGSEVIGKTMLTGKAIEIKEAREIISKVFNPFVWIFIVAICGFVAFIFFKKGYKKSFIGYIKSKKSSWKSKKKDKTNELRKESSNPKSTATLSLSIKGDKQDASVVCLKIKNFDEIKSQKGTAQEKINEIIDLAEDKKARTYENGEYLFFILAPAVTKTFKNEKIAIILAKEIKNELIKYNRLAQQKIEFGISINYGTIVAKKEGEILKFMSLKTFIPKSKKIATVSDQEILLTDDISERLRTLGGIKTEKTNKHGTTAYVIKQIRDPDKDSKFIGNFIKRLEKENKKD